MTADCRVVIVGAGPAGFAVAAALLGDDGLDVGIDLLDRAERPDGLLRHRPAAGTQRLRDVARDVDAVLTDHRVTYFGDVEVGDALPLEDLHRGVEAVVLATGAPHDPPWRIAGGDSVGIGTVTHVQAWLADNADVEVTELDLAMDTAVLIGVSAEVFGVAEALCGHPPAGIAAAAAARLAASKLRHVQLVDPRSPSEIDLPRDVPANLVLRAGLNPVGVVGRNRARALRCLGTADAYGRVLSEDLRAQLLFRPRAESFCWPGIDEDGGHIAHHDSRVLSGGTPVPGLYVAGWAGRTPFETGSHAGDVEAVLAAIHADLDMLPHPQKTLPELLMRSGLMPSQLAGWSATVATDVLLARFAGEGTVPLADYQTLLEQADED